MLAFLEKITLTPNEISNDDIAELRQTGLTDRAILDATYVCVGFNIIARIADALGFDVPSEELFFRAAKLLRVVGYRRLSGFWTSKPQNVRKRFLLGVTPPRDNDRMGTAPCFDPYSVKMTRLHHAVTASPASLPADVRQAITAGQKISGPLGSYVRRVAEQAYDITDEDIASLHAANFTDDEIFEATVSSALGAGLFRLDCVLRAFANQTTSTRPSTIKAAC